MSSNCKILLSYNNMEDYFQIPVNPSEVTISRGSGNKFYNMQNIGESTIIKALKPSEVVIRSYFPQHYSSACVVGEGDLLKPYQYNSKLFNWRSKLRPIRFHYISDGFELNMPVTIEAYDFTEVAGSDGDIEFVLKLKEYFFFSAAKNDIQSDGTIKEVFSRETTREAPDFYTVQPGDSFWSIAKKFWDDGSKYKYLMSINNITDEANIHAGNILRLSSPV